MGNIVSTTVDGLNYSLYGDQRQSNINYLAEQIRALPKNLGEFGQQTLQRAKEVMGFLTNDLLHSRIMSQVGRSNLIDESVIITPRTVEEFQNAGVFLQRYIMAHPDLRELYHEQNVAGYPDTYVDLDPNERGPGHYDYDLITDGMIMIDREADEVSVRFMDNHIQPSDREPSFEDKIETALTWDSIDWLLKETQFDFTSPGILGSRGG